MHLYFYPLILSFHYIYEFLSPQKDKGCYANQPLNAILCIFGKGEKYTVKVKETAKIT